MGLFCGVSILSIVELVTFCLRGVNLTLNGLYNHKV